MQFKAYPSYRKFDDTVLNTLPETWGNKPFWSVFTKSEIANQINEQLLSVYLDKGVILYSDGGGLVHKPAESLEKYQLVDVNDFVMNNQQAWRGSVGVSSYKGIVSPAYLIFKPKKDLNPQFLKYQLRDKYIIDQFMISSLSVGTIQRQIKNHLLRKIEIPIPSISEQTQIATFLDHETAKIDNLIAKQEKLIELLEEQRKSVISHAVTKGLDPNVPMKDSGIEWLGEIPKHWKILKFNRVVNKIADIDHYMPDSVDNGYPYLMTGDLQDKISSVDFSNCKKVSDVDYIHLSKKVKNEKGDLILARYATIGTVSYVDIKKDFLVSYSCVTIKPNVNIVNGEFLYFYIKSQTFSNFCRNYINTNTQGNLGIDSLKRVSLLLPSLTEQSDIVNLIKSENLKFDNLIAKQKDLIEKLKEYRASVISHAVTGKIDIRGLVA